MGGDKGPLITIPAAILAVRNIPELHLILCGDADIINAELSKKQCLEHPQLSIFPTTQVVAMDDKPIVALRSKKNSSMRKALDLLH
jgi:glycerol-3-phosphate acyltransferase PlsX